ncbi:hypothetical protein FOA52_013821 [Chlamydomonas sp. UWO 241]|nr:hypothetical protein FOA52_013821 [Chlamydomonas sp. UWO 241]
MSAFTPSTAVARHATGSGASVRSPCSTSAGAPVVRRRAASLITRAASDDDAELEKRLERLRTIKGATPRGQGAKAEKAAAQSVKTDTKPAWVSGETKRLEIAAEKAKYDYTGETLYYEGPPHRGDMVVNLALGTTLIWLPLTLAAIGRGAFVQYRFTDRRFSVESKAPWKTEKTEVAYQEVKNIVTVGRGIGLWGDMVVELRDGSKVEIRSLDRFVELKNYILERRDALLPPPSSPEATAASTAAQGFGKKKMGAVLTQEELMGEPAAPSGGKKNF